MNPLTLEHLFVMRLTDHFGDELTHHGKVQTLYYAQEIERLLSHVGVNKHSIEILCSQEPVMKLAGLDLAKALKLDYQHVFTCPLWPTVEITEDPEKRRDDGGELIEVNDCITARTTEAVIAILPKRLAEKFPLHFVMVNSLIKDKEIAPSFDQIHDGGFIYVQVASGSRCTVTLPHGPINRAMMKQFRPFPCV